MGRRDLGQRPLVQCELAVTGMRGFWTNGGETEMTTSEEAGVTCIEIGHTPGASWI